MPSADEPGGSSEPIKNPASYYDEPNPASNRDGDGDRKGEGDKKASPNKGDQNKPKDKDGDRDGDKTADKKAADQKDGDKKSSAEKDGDKKDGAKASEKADAEKKAGGIKKVLNPKVIIIVLILIAGLIAIQFFRNKPEGRPGWLRISGRVEGYEVNVGAKIAGRVMFVSNREGEEVTVGQPIVRLSDEDIQAQLRGAKARFDESLESVKEAEEQLKSAQEQVSQAKLNVSQSKEDAKGRVEQAEANIATQRAEASQAHANEVQAKADLELARVRKQRYDELVVKGAVTQDEDDQAHATYDSAVATVDARKAAVVAAERQVNSAQAGLLQANSNLLNPPIKLSQQAVNSRNVAQNEAAVERARHDVKNAKASIDEITANIQYLNINSPIHGVVTARTVEPGAVVAAGQTVLSLINLETVFLRAYVPDGEIGKVRLNQRALVYYDSAPKKGLEAKVIEIDPTASFTPENIYFRDDRVKQVFGIKLLIENPAYYAKPGMPADADIDISESSGGQEASRAKHTETKTVTETTGPQIQPNEQPQPSQQGAKTNQIEKTEHVEHIEHVEHSESGGRHS